MEEEDEEEEEEKKKKKKKKGLWPCLALVVSPTDRRVAVAVLAA